MTNPYTEGLCQEDILQQIPELEVQLANTNGDNREATEKHFAALREALNATA